MSSPDAPPGYIKLARKAFDSDLLWLEPREFSRFEAWLDMIQLACFARYRHVTRYGPIDLERGEFVASLRWLAARWDWSEKRVRGLLAILEKRAQLRAQRETQVGIVYLVVNYDRYQGVPQVADAAKGTDVGMARAQQGHKREAGKALTTTTSRELPRGDAFSLAPYIDAHCAVFPDSTPPAGRYGKVFKQLETKHGPVETLRRWKVCLDRKGVRAIPEELASHWSEYIELAYDNGEGFLIPSAIATLRSTR